MPSLIQLFRKSRSSLPLVLTLLLVSFSFIGLDTRSRDNPEPPRFPNSIKEFAAPEPIDKASSSHSMNHFHTEGKPSHVGKAKLYALLTIDLELLSLPPERREDVVKMRARIQIHQALQENLKYQWRLPAGSKLLGSTDLGELGPIQAGETYEIEATLTGLSSKDAVHFEGYFEQGSKKFGSNGVLNFGYQDPSAPAEFEAQDGNE